MTDKYDVDGHEHEGGDELEPKAETWSHDQPPDDDYPEGESLEETHIPSDEHTAPLSDENSVVAQPRKSSAFLPILIGIAGLCVFGAVLHWQFNKNAQRDMSVNQIATGSVPHIDSNVDSNAPKTVPDQDVAPKTSLSSAAQDAAASALPPPPPGSAVPNDMTSAPEPTPVVPPAPSTVSSTSNQTASAPPPVITPPPPSPVVASAPPPAPVMPAVAPPPPPAPAPIVSSKPTPFVPSSKPTPGVASVNTGEIDARISSLSHRIDDLSKQLSQATQQMEHTTAMINSAPPAPSRPVVPPALEERLDKVEQKLTKLEHQPKAAKVASAAPPADTLPPPASIAIDQDANQPMVDQAPPPKPAPAPVAAPPKPKKPKPVSAAKKTTSAKTPKSKPAPVVKASSEWVLRAATPDEAWLAKDATTKDLRHVQVGDDVPGIGRISSIHPSGDGWEVQGANGVIR